MTLRQLLLLACLALAGCSKDEGRVQISDAWSPAAPPGAAVLAVYAEISAAHADTLKSISSSAAQSVQIHSMAEVDGMMQMRHVPQVDLVPGETLRLEPGGLHLMLMGPRETFPVNAHIPLTFHFAHAGDVAVVATVRAR